MDNNDVLKDLMHEHELSPQQVAELLGMTREGVYNWTRSRDTSGYRKMPDPALKLLKITLLR
jgi:DNA-binding transcriptional regulator YiaG